MGTKFLFRLILEEDDSDGCPSGSVPNATGLYT